MGKKRGRFWSFEDVIGWMETIWKSILQFHKSEET